MNITKEIRIIARRFLPDSIRKPVGRLAGRIEGRLRYSTILPIQGLMFDIVNRGQFKTDGCVFKIPKQLTNYSIRGSLFENTYEISDRTLAQKFIQPEDSVMELGACLGILSCITNKMLSDKSRQLSVEANPQCIPTLRQNRDLNHCGFVIENCAVSNQPEVTFFLDPMLTSSTNKKNSGPSVKVAGRSLVEIYHQHGPFSVLIMDIEGGELETLKSSVDILRNFRLIIIELHDWIIGAEDTSRCREILQKSGFALAERVVRNEAWLRY